MPEHKCKLVLKRDDSSSYHTFACECEKAALIDKTGYKYLLTNHWWAVNGYRSIIMSRVYN